MNSPTSRSLLYERKQGFTAQVVEHWNHYARHRVDLFGIGDILSMGKGQIRLIQATSGNNVSHRLEKCLKSQNLGLWIDSGGHFLIYGWSKQGKRGKRKTWTLRSLNLGELIRKGLVKYKYGLASSRQAASPDRSLPGARTQNPPS